MNRRSLLQAGAAGLPLGLAGCSSVTGGSDAGETSATKTTTSGSAEVGRTRELDDLFTVSVDDVTLRETVLAPSDVDDEDAYLDTFRASEDAVLAIVTVSVENTGTREEALDGETFTLEQGEWYGLRDEVPTVIWGAEGTRFNAGGSPDVKPGATTTGYYLAKVPRVDAREALTVSASSERSETELTWQYPPDGDGERALPDVRVDSVSVPEAPTTGLEYDIELTVTNDGDADGVFRGLLQWQRAERWVRLERAASAIDVDSQYATAGVVQEPVPAGQTKTVTVPCHARYPQVVEFRVKSTDASWQTEFEPATLEVGAEILANQRTAIAVQDFRTPEELTVLDEDNDPTVERTADDRYFVAVGCRWERAEADVPSESPGEGRFTISTPNIDDVGERWQPDGGERINERWHSQIDRSLENHTSVTGWYVWTVSADFRVGNLQVSYVGDEPDDTDLNPLRANWTQN